MSATDTRVTPLDSPPGTWGVVVPPDELEELLGLTSDEAARVSKLVQITVEAYCWPTVVADPIPPPMHAVGLALAARFAGAELSKAGSLVGESIGSYSYRLASPLTFDSVVTVLGELGDALALWAPRHGSAYQLDVGWDVPPWPVDWWQSDLDNVYAYFDSLDTTG